MATIVPKLDRIRNAATGFNPTDEYTLSIIVFDRRPVDRQLVTDSVTGDPITEDQVGERVATIPPGGFYSGAPAFSGGDVSIVSRVSRGPSGLSDLELRSGDWVMFSGRKSVWDLAAASPAGFMAVHKWYRVVNAGEEPVPVDPTDSRLPIGCEILPWWDPIGTWRISRTRKSPSCAAWSRSMKKPFDSNIFDVDQMTGINIANCKLTNANCKWEDTDTSDCERRLRPACPGGESD